MSAGTIVFAKLSLRRAGTWPVPFGRPFAMAGWVSGAFSLRGCPLACGALPPCCAGLGAAGFVASAFAMALAPVDRLVAPTAGANLAAVGEDLDAGTRGLVAARAHDEHIGESQRPLPLDDAALPQLLRRALVLLDHVDVLHEHTSFFGNDTQHLAALAPLLAGDDADGVAVEADVGAVLAADLLHRAHHHRPCHLALLDGAVRRRLLDGDDHGVPQRGVALVGAAHDPDALHLPGAGVVGHVEHGAGLDHCAAFTRMDRMRQRFSLESGRVSSITTRSPTWLSFASSCALSFLDTRTTRW